MAGTKDPPDSVNIAIRPARLTDAPTIASLATQLGYPSSRDQIKKRMRATIHDRQHLVLAAELEDRVVGWAHAYVRFSIESDICVELGGLVVDESHRGLGVATKLLKEVEGWAQNKGGSAVCLRSNIIRNDAHKFYAARGYERVKIQHAFRKSLRVTG